MESLTCHWPRRLVKYRKPKISLGQNNSIKHCRKLRRQLRWRPIRYKRNLPWAIFFVKWANLNKPVRFMKKLFSSLTRLSPSFRFDRFRILSSESPISSSLERSQVDREAVLHIRLRQSLVSFVDLLNRNNFDIRSDVVFAAEVEHFLRLLDASDCRAGQTVTSSDQRERRDVEWLRWCADERDVSVAREQTEITVDVVMCRYSIENEVKCAFMLLHLGSIA